MNRISLTHFFSHFRTLGGVESILRHHLEHDAKCGIESRVVAFFEPAAAEQHRVVGLGLTWLDCIASARRKFADRSAPLESGVAVYHNAWGLPFLADLDRAVRRISLLHSDLPHLRSMLQSQLGLVDGILCVNEAIRDQARACLPSLEPERIAIVPYPITPPEGTVLRSPLRNRPMVCGFVGRLVKEQKRVDRLPQLCAALDASGLDYRLEILGDGPDRPSLERQLRGRSRIVFQGRKAGAAYWEVLCGWDVVVFVSDYEGLPISMLEALSVGVLPVYPRIGSGGDDYVAKVTENFLYPPGDFQRVAGVLRQLKESPDDSVVELRTRCRALTAPHRGDAYERAFSEFVRRIHQCPRTSAPAVSRRPFYWSDFCPFGVLRRLHYQGLFKRNDGSAGRRQPGCQE